MFPEHFYFTGAGWLGYFVYIPIALFILGLLYWLLLRRIPKIAIRLILLIILSVPLLTFPLWEALSISYEAEKLCKEQGGLHIYKTVETDGFLGGWGIETATKYGFSYVESGCGKYGRSKCRLTLKNDKEVREEIDEFTSRYHFSSEMYVKINDRFYFNQYYVEDRKTKEILGELIIISIPLSYFDLIAHIPFLASPNSWACGGEAPEQERYYDKLNKRYRYTFSDLIKATLKPLKFEE